MAKRFTDTDKWKRPWFSDLPNNVKLVWIYLLDDCDHRGVWHCNFKRISFDLGFEINKEKLNEWFGDKIKEIDSDKYFIKSFVDFQYSSLNPNNNAHKSIIELLNKLENKVLKSPSGGAQVTVTDKVKVKEELEKIYSNLYPLKKGKQKGIEKLAKSLTLADIPLFEKAVLIYKADCEAKGTSSEFIKHFSSFSITWRECLDPDYGKSNIAPFKKVLKPLPVESF